MRRYICQWSLLFFLLGFTKAYTVENHLLGELPELLQSDFDASSLNVNKGTILQSFSIARDSLGVVLDAIQNQSASVGALGATSPGGFAYELDMMGIPCRVASSLGSFFVSRAETLGKGKYSVGMSYLKIDYKNFDGTDLDDLLDFSVTATDKFLPDTILMDTDMELSTEVLTISMAYGLLDNVDVGIIVPHISHHSDGKYRLLSVQDESTTELDTGSLDGKEEGLGDISLFSKWNFYKSEKNLSLAAVMDIKTPTGNPDQALGTGKADVQLSTLLSKTAGKFSLNMEIGYNRSGLGNKYDTFKYSIAGGMALSDTATVTAEFIGSYSDSDLFDTKDGNVGIILNPYGDLVIRCGVRFPLDDNGLRPEIIPLVNLEYRF